MMYIIMCKFECKVTTFSVMPQVRLEKKRCSPLTDNILFITLRPNKQKGHMNWQQLISNKRLGQEYHHPMRHDDRSEFKRDSASGQHLRTQPSDSLTGGGKCGHVAWLGRGEGAEGEASRTGGHAVRGDWHHRECGLPGARHGQSAVRSFRRESHPDFLL